MLWIPPCFCTTSLSFPISGSNSICQCDHSARSANRGQFCRQLRALSLLCDPNIPTARFWLEEELWEEKKPECNNSSAQVSSCQMQILRLKFRLTSWPQSWRTMHSRRTRHCHWPGICYCICATTTTMTTTMTMVDAAESEPSVAVPAWSHVQEHEPRRHCSDGTELAPQYLSGGAIKTDMSKQAKSSLHNPSMRVSEEMPI